MCATGELDCIFEFKLKFQFEHPGCEQWLIFRSRLQKPLDSYQEEDLTRLREKWSDALMRRRQYLDQQIQKLINKQDKTEEDIEREQSLVDQWVSYVIMIRSTGRKK